MMPSAGRIFCTGFCSDFCPSETSRANATLSCFCHFLTFVSECRTKPGRSADPFSPESHRGEISGFSRPRSSVKGFSVHRRSSQQSADRLWTRCRLERNRRQATDAVFRAEFDQPAAAYGREYIACRNHGEEYCCRLSHRHAPAVCAAWNHGRRNGFSHRRRQQPAGRHSGHDHSARDQRAGLCLSPRPGRRSGGFQTES
jgi:hypothetical protein